MMRRDSIKTVLVALMLLSGGGARAQGSPVPLPPSSFNDRVLARHNAERMRVGVPRLLWSESLATGAQQWAKHLAAINQLTHSPSDSNNPEGENLWMGTKGAYEPEEMVQGWIDEGAQFTGGVFPKVSKTGNWADVGHYTQLIWSKTTQVGCGVASNNTDSYLVCRYAPAGNWMGENPLQPTGTAHPTRK